MNKQEKIKRVLSMLGDPNPIGRLKTDEIAFLMTRFFDPKKRHNVIRSIINTPNDQHEANKIKTILTKLPRDIFTHVTINVIKPTNDQQA